VLFRRYVNCSLSFFILYLDIMNNRGFPVGELVRQVVLVGLDSYINSRTSF